MVERKRKPLIVHGGSMPEVRFTATELHRLVEGLSPKGLNDYIAEGVIHRGEDKRFGLDAVFNLGAANGRNKLNEAIGRAEAAEARLDNTGSPADQRNLAQASKDTELARKAKLEADEKEGSLISAEAVRLFLSRLIVQFSEVLRGAPPALVDELDKADGVPAKRKVAERMVETWLSDFQRKVAEEMGSDD